MAQTVPRDGACIRAQAKNCEDQHRQHGTITAVRNCPHSAAVHGGNNVDCGLLTGDCGLLTGHRTALQQAQKQLPMPVLVMQMLQHGSLVSRSNWSPSPSQTARAAELLQQSAQLVAQCERTRLEAARLSAEAAAATSLSERCAMVHAQSAMVDKLAEEAAASNSLNLAMVGLLLEAFEQGQFEFVATSAQASGGGDCTHASAVPAQPSSEPCGGHALALLLSACAATATPDGARQCTWESTEAGHRAWRFQLMLQLTWAMGRRMHRALGRTYPSNDIGPRK
jgi:hypothetical protein